jgi:amino acid transporter
VSAADLLKRAVLGRAIRSDKAGEQELPKYLALPIFASDPLSSVAYATQEVLVVLTLAGTAYLYLTPWLATGVVVLLTVVVLSYRQLVHAYPSGGGDYEVASKNLGSGAGMVVASALLVDYVLTVAVSVSAGVDNIISAATGLADHRVLMALGFVVLLVAMNLRGVKESGKAFAIPTYGFVLGIGALVIWGLVETATGDRPRAESAGYTVIAEHGKEHLVGLALVFFVLRAFSSGCTALTGVEAIANGVPAFRKPKSKNAATTLALMGLAAMGMFIGITALAIISKVRYSEDPVTQFVGFDGVQRSVIAQVSSAVFGDGSFLFLYLQIATAAILVLAANTAFNGFPLLGSILAQDRYLPRQLHNRGDRLVFSNGVLLLATFAAVLIVAFQADVTKLIQLYIIGVFTSFTFGQTGMVRHWNRLLRDPDTAPAQARRYRRSRAINFAGASLTGGVLIVVTITKFTHGAYIVLIAMPVLYALMMAIHTHYANVARELEVQDHQEVVLPSRNHAIVLVSKIHAPTIRALAYAKATRPHDLTALTVAVDEKESKALQAEWDRRGIQVPLTVLASPYREITRPIIEYVKAIALKSPRDVVSVYIPEYVVGRWWEQLLHNQSALRLKGRLLFVPNVMVTSVPWQLKSSDLRKDDDQGDLHTSARRPAGT